MANNNNNDQLLISYLTLRKAVGWLGILLPVALFIGNFAIGWFTDFEDGCNPYKRSISHYYYTRLSELFTGTMCAVALFLFNYKGYPKKEGEGGLSDRFLSTLAACFALGVVFFPASSEIPIACSLRTFLAGKVTGYIHLTSAMLFFFTLAYTSYFNFTKTSGIVTPEKLRRNRLYRICAAIMVICILSIALYLFILEGKINWFDNIHPIFCLEALALWAFGLSWLTKGEFLLEDRFD
jgi:hypothetical protein